MRNPLKRLARRDHPHVPLRERFASAKGKLVATKEKYARTLRVHRALNGPLPQSEPAVDRAALVNYSTFLALERERVCAELYPHLGVKASRFVLSMNEAWSYFHTGRNGTTTRKDLLPSSSRAVRILNDVGIDWRKDRDVGGLDLEKQDTGERPRLPRGFPSPDAELLDALDLLSRTHEAQEAFLQTEDNDADAHPAFVALGAARDDALIRLARTRAKTLRGLQAKARAIKINADCAYSRELVESLILDLLEANDRALLPHPRS